MLLLDGLDVDVTSFETATGWKLMPEGACRGDVCIPLSDQAVNDGRVDVAAIADQMGLPLVHDDDHAISALGPWPGTGRALVSAQAPEVVLPDLDGNDFRLSSLLGRKVLILSWAPY